MEKVRGAAMDKESKVAWELVEELVSQTETWVMSLSFHVSLAAWVEVSGMWDQPWKWFSREGALGQGSKGA